MTKIVPASAMRVLVIGAHADGSHPAAEEVLAPDGTLILMEGEPDRAARARLHFNAAGIAGRATVISGDPRRMLHKLAGPFDLIFLRDSNPSLRGPLEKLLAHRGRLIEHGDA